MSEHDEFSRSLLAAARRETPTADLEARVLRAAEQAVEVRAPAVDVHVAPESRRPLVRAWSMGRAARYAFGAAATAAALLLVAGGVFVKKQSDESAAAAAQAARTQADLQNQINAAKAEVDKQGAAVRLASGALASAKDDAARAQAQHDLDIAMQKQRAAGAALMSVRSAGAKNPSPSPAPGAPEPCVCSKMDPLCGCIQ